MKRGLFHVIVLTSAIIPLHANQFHRVSNNVSIGVRSAIFSIHQQQKSIFDTSSCHVGNTHNNNDEIKNPKEKKIIYSSDLLNVPNTVDDYQNERNLQKQHHPISLLKGRRGGFTTHKNKHDRKKKKIALFPPVSAYNRPLLFWENMICGALSRATAQTIMFPANTMKTILQSRSQAGVDRQTLMQLAKPQNIRRLSRGARGQFFLSLPQGAVTFAVLEFVKGETAKLVAKQMETMKKDKKKNKIMNSRFFGPGLDFFSSAVSTFCCSAVATPQTMIMDNIMAGTYQNVPEAVKGISKMGGIKGFYTGWGPGLAGKIPSYGLTWVFFQQLKQLQLKMMNRDPKNIENTIMGCMASATTVCIMIPMDTIKTRLVTQVNYPNLVPYNGIADCAKRVLKEEGIVAFYRGLSPRLLSVVPMIGIQFGVYEFMKKVTLAKNADLSDEYKTKREYELNENDLQDIIIKTENCND